MLQMMSEINHALHENGMTAQQVHAIVGPDDVDGSMVLRVNLHALKDHAQDNHGRGALLTSREKPLDLGADLQLEIDDLCDALATIGVEAVSVALRLSFDGHAQDARPYRAN